MTKPEQLNFQEEILQNRIEQLEKENNILKEEIKKSRKEQREYLQNVSHQLVAPLNAMKWHIENIIAARISVDRAKKVFRSIYSQATIAVHLTKNFNLMSNLETDHALSNLKEPLREVALCQLLINLADDFQPLAWDKNIQINVIHHNFEDAPAVLVMKPLISQVYSNIIENAIKYSEKGTDIMIEGYHHKQNKTVIVIVSNQGIEITKENIKRIFDRGFRTKEAKNLYPAGTGFGLYIARRIVEIHEGLIGVKPGLTNQVKFIVELSIQGLKGKARSIVR